MPRIAVRDLSVYYETHGPEPGSIPLLLIHGLGSSTRDWQKQVDFFARTRRVVTFDLRGHGRTSQPSGPYSIPLFAGDTIDLVRRLGLGSVHVAGLSMGGMVALQLALDAPALVRSLTVVNSGANYQTGSLRQRLTLWERRLALRLLSMRQVGAVLGRRLFPDDPNLQREMAARWSTNDARAYRASFEAIMGWSARDRLHEIQQPTLIIAAQNDYLPLEHYHTYAQKMPAADVTVLEGMRHAVPVEHPDAFNATLEAFLEKLGG